MYRVFRQVIFLIFLLSLAFTVKAQSFTNQIVKYSGNFAPVALNQTFAYYQSGVTGHSVSFIMGVQPGSALSLFVTAKSATFTGTDQVNVNFFTTGNPNVTSCSSGGSLVDGWTPIVMQTYANGTPTGTAGSIAHFLFSISSTSVAIGGIMNAAQVCVQIINNATFASVNDTFDMYASFTPNALATNGVSTTGVVDCQGGPPSVSAGNVTLPIPCDNTGLTVVGGLYLGHQSGVSVGQTLSAFMQSFGTVNGAGPLAVLPFAISATGAPIGLESTQNLCITNSCPGAGSLLTTSGGMYFQTTNTYASSTTTSLFANLTQSVSGIANACTIEVNVTGAVTGTGPTMNVYFQDSDGNGVWTDRISFTQFTAATRQVATVVTGTAGVVPFVPTTGTLAAGTIINGPIRQQSRIQIVLGGTTPSFGAVRITASCT